MRDGKNVKQSINTIISWFGLLDPVDQGFFTGQETFARTIFCNRVSKTEIGAWTTSDFLRGLLGAYGYLCQKYSLQRKYIDPALTNGWDAAVLKAKEIAQSNGTGYDAKSQENTWLTWIRNASFRMWDREFFLTTTGVIGLTPEQAREGDRICIPLGCSVPLVVREREGADGSSRDVVIVGEAYVDGFMYGRAIELVEEGELDLDEWIVH